MLGRGCRRSPTAPLPPRVPQPIATLRTLVSGQDDPSDKEWGPSKTMPSPMASDAATATSIARGFLPSSAVGPSLRSRSVQTTVTMVAAPTSVTATHGRSTSFRVATRIATSHTRQATRNAVRPVTRLRTSGESCTSAWWHDTRIGCRSARVSSELSETRRTDRPTQQHQEQGCPPPKPNDTSSTSSPNDT